MGKTPNKKPITKGVAKVPVIIQMEALECGAASLDMILAYYDKWIPLEQVRADCGVSRDGSKARNILHAARYYGLKATGFTCEPDALKADGTFPCIIHWNFNHFVVLKGFKGGKAYLNDPGGGEYSVSMDEFDECFTGVVLTFEPTDQFECTGKPEGIRDYLGNHIKGIGPAVVFVAFVTAVASIAGVIEPIFNRVYIDRLLKGQNPEWITYFLVALFVLYLIEVIAQVLSSVTLCKINGKLAITSTYSFMWKLLHLPVTFFSQRMSGDILSRQAANAQVTNTLINVFAPICLNTIMMVFYLVVMIRYSVVLTVIGVLTILINAFITIYISKKKVNLMRVSARDAGKQAANTTAGIKMMETIKSSGSEEGYFAQWAGYDANYNNRLVKVNDMDTHMVNIPAAVTTVSGMLILALGVYLTFNDNFTLGMVSSFQGLLTAFMAPATSMITAGQTVEEMKSEMERINDVMNYPDDDIISEKGKLDDIEFDKLRGEIEISNVSFGYSTLEPPIIKDFSINIKPGSRVAFVGTSGSGKSTLSKLISGLYKPWSGEIKFDGMNLEDIDKRIFRSSVAVVDQDIVMFEDTVANNIRLFDNSIEDYEVIMAARDAQMHNDLMERPEGYQLKLIDGGTNVSGGQRQRLEIARVLAQDPTIIIMDEATSALDAKTEYDVVKNIKNRGITCIVIAHRLSTIRDCDEIVVLEDGIVVERGTHEELMARAGKYLSLVINE